MVFSSVKEINSLRKQINRLLSKGMPNIYPKVTIEKNCRSQNFNFIGLKEVWEQNCVWLFYYFNFERNYDVLKSKSPCILLNKNINFNKNETESKMEKF